MNSYTLHLFSIYIDIPVTIFCLSNNIFYIHIGRVFYLYIFIYNNNDYCTIMLIYVRLISVYIQNNVFEFE